MPMDYTTEELIINDSFINYCLGRNAEDILFWEEVAHVRPDLSIRMQEAAEIVLGLHTMLQREVQGGMDETSLGAERRGLYRRIWPYAAAVAAVALVGWLVWGMGLKNGRMQQDMAAAGPEANGKEGTLTYVTQRGERRFFVLPDSTRVYLGAGSNLRLAAGFAALNREVHLSGEALFDVPANAELPFIVHSSGQDVNVLGTLFNVKAYPEEEIIETSLIRGKVELVLTGSTRRWPLMPNQKMIVNRAGGDPGIINGKSGKLVLLPLSYSAKDSAVIETVWAKGRLEIVNESFADIRKELERWYNVNIEIKDKAVEGYTFTATFTHEDIGEILKILQQTYYFNYRISGDKIIITK